MIPHPPSTTQKDRVMLELNDTDLGNIKDKLVGSSEKTQSSKFTFSCTNHSLYIVKMKLDCKNVCLAVS